MRLSSEKDPLAWLAVVERVMATFPDVRAILVGDGPLSKELSTRVDSLGLNDRVHLMGYDGDIVSYLREATLLLLTSRIEGFPNVVLEAQMYERPVVATNVGGCREVLAEGLQRYIRESGDIDGLSEACLDMLRHPRHVEALGESARKFVLEKFSMDRLVTNTLALTSRP
jgi:glycosyltransferase involved in cell wall biosynthesis